MKDFKPMRELINALYSIAKAIGGEQQSSEKEYFKMNHAPIGVCVLSDINAGLIDDKIGIIDIEEFYNRFFVNAEEIDTDGKHIMFVYDEIPDPVDFSYVSVESNFIDFGSTCTINNTPDNWYYRELSDYPGKYFCMLAG